ncbi:Bifunctional NAD(P)H-hydrate repair enzyme Nnr [Gemmata obscuriglobus]|uniref:NAD(P)H-hydrate epimerase n=1 Tax=Gemmata obscuriglobus TaxID=114 RepID=A0A2Z3GVA2_9BACT|nr:NAD(P)H-hydrate epimerase [Gemmata obscuriglobus]AWM36471.1 NAD(P)H-hydrate epimerase [Gemmata obscuriglobus]QEG30904.1 Bifunctional NAD(P)H-hydrate repair enzyme Nnr [Gemmata obscuriglobus]VTS10237.1 NAD(P)H-hydrate epimerase OS=Planctomyces maris DSM 8797 GN=nnrE PE=3 SV=1: YjeF_N [Gemmata obscuriglobus UQM 2246]
MFTLSRSEVRELDRRAIEEFGVPGVVLMENAGRGAAELLMRLNPDRKAVVILCGPGNNGGDGFVIARHLDNAGWPVWTIDHPGTTQLTGDAAVNRKIIERSAVPMLPWLPEVLPTPAGWLIDALFGTGLNRALDERYTDYFRMLNTSGYQVLAIDIPSGLDCDTGEPLGPAVRATHTATFVAPKRGFLNPKSKEWTGEVHTIDIGAPRALVDQYRRSKRV